MNEEIKNVVNEIIKNFVCRPWTIYVQFITKSEVNLVYINGEKAIRLNARTYQDNYYNELVDRAYLYLDIYTIKGEGYSIGTGSQYGPLSERELEEGCWEQPEEFSLIEKVIRHFNGIYSYYKKLKELEKESRDISPGSPIDMLNEEFYSKDWTI